MDIVLIEFAQRWNRLLFLSTPDVEIDRFKIAKQDYYGAFFRLLDAGYTPEGTEVADAIRYVHSIGNPYGMEMT